MRSVEVNGLQVFLLQLYIDGSLFESCNTVDGMPNLVFARYFLSEHRLITRSRNISSHLPHLLI
jgi:hypothetical protein